MRTEGGDEHGQGGDEEDGQGGDEDGRDDDEASGDPSIQTTNIPYYTMQPGCPHDMTDKTPISFFKLFIDNDMLGNLVDQTNLYAEQFIANAELGPRFRVHNWSRVPHDINEMKRFLALIVTMGLVSYPTPEDYWSTSWPYSNEAFSKVNLTHTLMYMNAHTDLLAHAHTFRS